MQKYVVEEVPAVQPKYLFILFALFSSTWLASNVAAVKLVSIFGITLTGGFLSFPFATMLNTIIIEQYGFKNSRQVLWSGSLFNLVFIIWMLIVNFIPASPHWQLQNEFQNILIPSSRIIFSSLLSFLVADFINGYTMAKLKIKDVGEALLKRVIISSLLATIVDITLFFTLAFLNTMPMDLFIKTYFLAFIKRILFQIICLPVLWYLIDLMKKKEGFEVFDYDTDFNPFSLENVYSIHNYEKRDKMQAAG